MQSFFNSSRVKHRNKGLRALDSSTCKAIPVLTQRDIKKIIIVLKEIFISLLLMEILIHCVIFYKRWWRKMRKTQRKWGKEYFPLYLIHISYHFAYFQCAATSNLFCWLFMSLTGMEEDFKWFFFYLYHKLSKHDAWILSLSAGSLWS